jgi:cytochrome c peroxidase
MICEIDRTMETVSQGPARHGSFDPRGAFGALLSAFALLVAPACSTGAEPDAAALAKQAAAIFGPLPASAPNAANPSSQAKIDLGRMLYYDARLSKNHDISCNSCHQLDRYGVDGEPTSPGHKGQRGGRNSPTVYNAALHNSQFWDGREPDVEAQAKGPVTNPIEMALPDPATADQVLRSIPGYAPLFAAAFPDQPQPVSFDNMALAIGAFERELITPGPFDDFMKGKTDALGTDAQRGLSTFIETGCITCHMGPAVGGGMFQKVGLIETYETDDQGRFEVTGLEVDRFVFKVPSLRNIAETGPYFHDGSIGSLDQAVRLMARHQLGKQLDDQQLSDILAFLGSLTGEIDKALVAQPKLPASGPDTPKPDPS